jgi:hypothetical protein
MCEDTSALYHPLEVLSTDEAVQVTRRNGEIVRSEDAAESVTLHYDAEGIVLVVEILASPKLTPVRG